jgi:hypothetical protein
MEATSIHRRRIALLIYMVSLIISAIAFIVFIIKSGWFFIDFGIISGYIIYKIGNQIKVFFDEYISKGKYITENNIT